MSMIAVKGNSDINLATLLSRFTAVRVCLSYVLYYSVPDEVKRRISALGVKLTKLVLQVGWSSCNLTSWRK